MKLIEAFQGYINIEDMDKMLKPEKGWEKKKIEGTYEYVYEKHLKGKPYFIRIYTTVSVHKEKVRKIGSDAIRIIGFIKKEDKIEPRTKSIVVKRTDNWRTNLYNGVNKIYHYLKNKTE